MLKGNNHHGSGSCRFLKSTKHLTKNSLTFFFSFECSLYTKNKRDELDILLTKMGIHFDLIVLNETDYFVLPKNEHFVLNCKKRRGGGVAMLVNNLLNVSLISEFTSITDNYEVPTVQGDLTISACCTALLTQIYRLSSVFSRDTLCCITNANCCRMVILTLT